MKAQNQPKTSDNRQWLRLINQLFSRSERGYSLVELLVTLAISAIGLIGGTMLYRSAHRASTVVSTVSEMHQRARIALAIMEQELQETNVDVTWDHAGDIGVTFYAPRSGTDMGSEFVVDDEGNPSWERVVVYFFYPYNNTLYRYSITMDGSETSMEKLATNVTDAYFDLDDNLLEIRLEVAANMELVGQSELVTSTVSTKVLLRN